jgi:hypothetical protein
MSSQSTTTDARVRRERSACMRIEQKKGEYLLVLYPEVVERIREAVNVVSDGCWLVPEGAREWSAYIRVLWNLTLNLYRLFHHRFL